MLPPKSYVDPMRVSYAPQAEDKSCLQNKAARRKQWLGGPDPLMKIRQELWSGMGLDAASYAAWTDLAAYCHAPAESIMRGSNDPDCPAEMLITPIFHEYSHRDTDGQTAVIDNIYCFLQRNLRRQLLELAMSGACTLPGYMPAATSVQQDTRPTYNLKDFQVLYPASAKHLPFHASVISGMQEKLKQPAAISLWTDYVQAHNEQWNPKGMPWTGGAEKRPASVVEGTASSVQKKARVITRGEADPADKDALLKAKKNQISVVKHDDHELLFTWDGELWAVGGTKPGVLDSSKPIACIHGEFLIGEDGRAQLEKPDQGQSFNYAITSEDCKLLFTATLQNQAFPTGVGKPASEVCTWLEQHGVDIDHAFAEHDITPETTKDDVTDQAGPPPCQNSFLISWDWVAMRKISSWPPT